MLDLYIQALEIVEGYRLLITGKVLRELARSNPARRPRLSAFLNSLITGEWESWPRGKSPRVHVWREASGGRRLLYSTQVDDDCDAIWERVWTVNILSALSYPRGAFPDPSAPESEFASHIILHELERVPILDQEELHYLGVQYVPLVGTETASLTPHDIEDEVTYNEELYLLSSSRLPDLLAGKQQGLPLHMGREQASVLAAGGPVLLSGEAGSGKTTVITHWLVVNQLRHPGQTQLFVTFSDRLRDKTRIDFELMLPPPLARDHQTRFLTYRELLTEILLQGGVQPPEPSGEMTFERYMREYAAKVSRDLDSVLVWDEIRSVLKGGIQDGTEGLMQLDVYEQLSEARGRCKTPKELRGKYRADAEAYQKYLARNGLWDAVDLAFQSLSVADQSRKFDRIACDEVQDLAPVEIAVLLRLLRDKRLENTFFTGDVAQVINPSGFSWSRLKGDLGRISPEVDIPDAKVLRRNFRCSRQIVDLVNAVLGLRKEVLEDEVSNHSQMSYFDGPAHPMVLTGSPLHLLQQIRSSPQTRLVLVKNNNQKRALQEELGGALEGVSLLTVEEAKGLEWEGALLWNFFVPRHEQISKNDWEALFVPERRTDLIRRIQSGARNPYALTYEFNLLHVGLTRARKLLFAYDEHPSRGIMQLDQRVATHLREATPDVFRAHWETKAPSAKELFDLATRLAERDRKQSLRFFRSAAVQYEREQDYSNAARAYESAAAYDLAAGCHAMAGDKASELRALALQAEAKGDWKDGGERWRQHASLLEQANDPFASDGYRRALIAYQRAGDKRMAAEVAMQRARSLPDERVGERAPLFLEAAGYCEERKQHDLALIALRAAIRDGETLKRAGNPGVGGQSITSWLASCYFRMATAQKEVGSYAEAAITAREAAGLWGVARETADEIQKPLFAARFEDALASALEWAIRAGNMEAASAIRKQLSSALRTKPDKFREIWTGIVELLKVVKKDAMAGAAIEYADFARANGKEGDAIRYLREQADWCISHESDPEARQILTKLVDLAEVSGTFADAAWAGKQLAAAEERLGLSLEAAISYRWSGAAALQGGQAEEATKLFMDGIRIARQNMTPSSVGWYVFKEIAMEYFQDTRSTEETLRWVLLAAEEFALEARDAESRLMGYLKRLEDAAGKLRSEESFVSGEGLKQDLEKRAQREIARKGWTLFCVARSAHLAGLHAPNERWGALALEAWSKASSAFDEIGQPDVRDRLSRAVSATS